MTLLSLIKENTNKANFVKLIGTNPIFNTCSKRELVNTFKGGQYLDYDEGQVLFSKGDCPQHVFLIELGGFKVVKDAKPTTSKNDKIIIAKNKTINKINCFLFKTYCHFFFIFKLLFFLTLK